MIAKLVERDDRASFILFAAPGVERHDADETRTARDLDQIVAQRIVVRLARLHHQGAGIGQTIGTEGLAVVEPQVVEGRGQEAAAILQFVDAQAHRQRLALLVEVDRRDRAHVHRRRPAADRRQGEAQHDQRQRETTKAMEWRGERHAVQVFTEQAALKCGTL